MDKSKMETRLDERAGQIEELKAELAKDKEEITDKNATIKHLRNKAEFDMPVDMRGKFFNACTDPCDMVDGPCACGGYHSVKEWLGKLIKRIDQAEAKLTTAKETNQWLWDQIQARRQWQTCPACNKVFATQS